MCCNLTADKESSTVERSSGLVWSRHSLVAVPVFCILYIPVVPGHNISVFCILQHLVWTVQCSASGPYRIALCPPPPSQRPLSLGTTIFNPTICAVFYLLKTSLKNCFWFQNPDLCKLQCYWHTLTNTFLVMRKQDVKYIASLAPTQSKLVGGKVAYRI